jgi:hypothetical protein
MNLLRFFAMRCWCGVVLSQLRAGVFCSSDGGHSSAVVARKRSPLTSKTLYCAAFEATSICTAVAIYMLCSTDAPIIFPILPVPPFHRARLRVISQLFFPPQIVFLSLKRGSLGLAPTEQ